VKLLERSELEESLGFKFGHRNLLVTFHPSTLDEDATADQMTELLNALEDLKDTTLFFTIPNADTGGRTIIKMLNAFVLKHPSSKVFSSLGQLRYLSLLAQVDGLVGNSSSGLTEAPSFKKGTINIGDRQKGRLRAVSVIDCDPTRESITAALSYMYSDEFNSILECCVNPYGLGGATQKIIKKLTSYPLEGILKKNFYDLSIKCFKESI
jgi:GDP/UDP-N,N'-diacetylbacillosamine 2-epimerase (hydrolysing)